MFLSFLALLSLVTVGTAQYQQWPPVVRQQKQQPSSHNLNGNVGVYGSGSGDVYVGKLGDGLYGAGTRFGGVAGITGGVGYAGGQGLRGKRSIVTSRLIGSATGETTRTDDMFVASGAVKGAANMGFESAEESAETSTQTSTTSTTSKQVEETTNMMKKTVCSPRRMRAGRR